MLEVRWVVDDYGRPQLVTSQRYQEMLQKQVEVQNLSSSRNYWFMQDGVTSQTTDLKINFLIKTFRGRRTPRQLPLGQN